MTTRVSSRGKRRPRRTQPERSAETRKKIIDAVIAVVAEEGLSRASSSRIAQRAGVTWGAVQYHFGAKADILDAVLDEGLAHFARRVEGLALDGRPLEQRVSLLVDRCWQHYSSPHYRAMLEIVLAARGGEEPDRRIHYERLAEAVDHFWSKAFADLALSPERRSEVEMIAFSALSGLAVRVMLRRGALRMQQELDVLKRVILRLLRGSAD